MKEETAQTPSSPTMEKGQKSDSTKSSKNSDKPIAPFTSSNDSPSSKEIKNSICRYLIESGQDFSVAAPPGFKNMINLCLWKVGCTAPTVEELAGSIFNDVVQEMDVYVSDIKSSWADTGCSVLLDEWADPNGRRLMNVLVDCPKGAIYLNSHNVSDIGGDNINAIQNFFEVILSEIGISNVVQVVTNSTSLITNEVGMQLTDRFRSVFWTQSTSCCIELMLEEISAIDRVKEVLAKADIIAGFVNSRPDILEHLSQQRNGPKLVKGLRNKSFVPFRILENMVIENRSWFSDSSPMRSLFTSTEDGKKIVELLSDRSFPRPSLNAAAAAMNLVRVIDWIDEHDRAKAGYIYKQIEQTSNALLACPESAIIPKDWREKLRNPLHSAGYFLNQNTIYWCDSIDPEAAMGFLFCVVRSSEDVRVLDRVVLQLQQYRLQFEQNRNSKKPNSSFTEAREIPPVEWWSEYGKNWPELQRLAIRILSQTCDGASRFRLDRNLAETLLLTTEEEGRDPSEQQKLHEMVRLRYNMMLQKIQTQ